MFCYVRTTHAELLDPRLAWFTQYGYTFHLGLILSLCEVCGSSCCKTASVCRDHYELCHEASCQWQYNERTGDTGKERVWGRERHTHTPEDLKAPSLPVCRCRGESCSHTSAAVWPANQTLEWTNAVAMTWIRGNDKNWERTHSFHQNKVFILMDASAKNV